MRSLRSQRARAALVLTVALTAVPVVLGAAAPAGATAPPLTCRGVSQQGDWQKVDIGPFRPVQGVPAKDTVTAYAVSAQRPGTVAATNGTTLELSRFGGCDWTTVLSLGATPSANVPVSGQAAKIVSVAVLPDGRVLTAVREGTGPASRPHVLGSDTGAPDSFAAADTGLPVQGAPALLAASPDPRVVYLVVTPVPEDGTGAGSLPAVPPVDLPTSSGGKAGLLYASTDGGHTWTLRTSVTDLLGGAGLDQLAVDHGIPGLLYATSNGLLYTSQDGGATFTRVAVSGGDAVTAIETTVPGSAVAFTRRGQLLATHDGGRTFSPVGRTLPGVTSAAFRAGDSRVAVEAHGLLALVDLSSGALLPATGPMATPGSLRGDLGPQSTFHGLFEHTLLRYVDPPSHDPPPVAVDDLPVPPPPPGALAPAKQTVQLPVGTARVLDYSLSMPKSPTPLDLFFLIDTSGSMSPYIENLKTNIGKITHAVQSAGINLQVGVGTLGTGPRPGEAPTPEVDVNDPTGGGSQLYKLFRRIGPVDDDFARALQSVTIKNQPGNNPAEAQLAALEQATFGPGIRDPRSPDAAPVYFVQPGQDAGWRKAAGIRRIIVHATDEAFDKPLGSPVDKNGNLDFDRVIREMNRFGVQQIGITTGAIESRDDLAKIARGTRTLAPAGGADCGEDVILPAGKPLVCDTEGDFSALIGRLVRSLQDRQAVSLALTGTRQVVPSFDAPALRQVDVTRPNRLPFTATVSCRSAAPGAYPEKITASLRGTVIATAEVIVDCVAPAPEAALPKPPAPQLPVPNQPPPAPVVVAAFAPAPPAAQPVGQPQPNVQAQPLTAAATQQQEELQLALALQATEEAPDGEGETELAMIGLRRRDESAAFLLLVSAMAASTGLGIARLRTRTSPSVVRARR
jgi:hypothetical protein